jgi:hypothetical protein
MLNPIAYEDLQAIGNELNEPKWTVQDFKASDRWLTS